MNSSKSLCIVEHKKDWYLVKKRDTIKLTDNEKYGLKIGTTPDFSSISIITVWWPEWNSLEEMADFLLDRVKVGNWITSLRNINEGNTQEIDWTTPLREIINERREATKTQPTVSRSDHDLARVRMDYFLARRMQPGWSLK